MTELTILYELWHRLEYAFYLFSKKYSESGLSYWASPLSFRNCGRAFRGCELRAAYSMSRHHTHLNARRWAAVRLAVFKRDGLCVMCGRAGKLECDHISPVPPGLFLMCR